MFTKTESAKIVSCFILLSLRLHLRPKIFSRFFVGFFCSSSIENYLFMFSMYYIVCHFLNSSKFSIHLKNTTLWVIIYVANIAPVSSFVYDGLLFSFQFLCNQICPSFFLDFCSSVNSLLQLKI